MKRKLLFFAVLFVLGEALLQNPAITVKSPKEKYYDSLRAAFSGELVGTISSFENAKGYDVINIKCMDHKLGVSIYISEGNDVNYQVGDILKVTGNFIKPKHGTNPGQFDNYNYARARGKDLTVFDPEISVVGSEASSFFNRIKNKLVYLKRVLSHIIDKSADPETAGVLKAMLLGDKTELPDNVKEDFQRCNINHLTALSGLHIGLIAGTVYKLLRLLGLPYLFSGTVGIFFTFSYGYMTGASDSTMRAAIMLTFVIVGDILGRFSDLLTAMAVSLFILVFSNPLKLYDTGFLFSYAAVIGIGVVYPCLSKLIPDYDIKKYSGVRKFIYKILYAFISSLLFSISVLSVTLPLNLYFYGSFCPWSVLLNLIVIPLAAPLLLFGIVGILVGLLSYSLAGILLVPSKLILRLYMGLCGVTVKLPYSTVIAGAMKSWQMILYYGLLVMLCALLFLGRERGDSELMKRPNRDHFLKLKKLYLRSLFVNISLLVVSATLIVLVLWRPKEDMVTFLDVGQGDSILLRTRCGETILVDGGSSSEKKVGENIILPALKHYGISRVDHVIITHSDMDHINGIVELLNMQERSGVKVGTFYMPYACKDVDTYKELAENALNAGTSVSYLRPGMKLNKEGFTMTCIYPKADRPFDNANDMSTVMVADYDGVRLLLTGDIGSEAEPELYSYKDLIEDIDILKVAHHGSRYSTSDEFLDIVKPKSAVISCERGGSYGHPHKELIERLEEHGVKWTCTSDIGAFEVRKR